MKIVTIDCPLKEVLKKKTLDIQNHEWDLALEIAENLKKTLLPLMPAAGLAAPQIGISKSVFIYSYDRQPVHLEVVINPTYTPLGEEIWKGWEGCFSVILSEKTWKLAKVPRYKTILVQYLNLEGKSVEKILEGFAAKVFQHEYDHLQGIENIDRPDAEILSFESKEELIAFMQAIRHEDADFYKAPQDKNNP